LVPEVKVTSPRVKGAAEGGIVEVDAAAAIAKIGVAAILVEAALGLLQVVREAAHLGGEGEARAAHLAERAGTHQHALVGVGPVDAPDFDGGVIVEARGEVVLAERVGAQRARHLQVVDGQADSILDVGGGEARSGLEGGAVEGEVAIVVGEAEAGAVGARQTPAPGEGGGARVEVGLESWGEGFHASFLPVIPGVARRRPGICCTCRTRSPIASAPAPRLRG
jgi:hypothetical protein